MMAYEKEGGSTIFRLGNEIAGKTSELEKIKMEIKSLQEKAELDKSIETDKMREFAQVLMAIDNIETTCFKREGISN